MKRDVEKRSSEHGGAGVKFLMVIVGIVLIANAGYQWIPVAYAGESLKQEMQTAVIQGMALPGTAGNPAEVTKRRLQTIALTNQLPPDAIIEVRQQNNTLRAHVSYRKPVPLLPFGIYTYTYEFDYTATPTGFLTKQ